MQAAIGDAAFMTQMEKNSDIVVMNCYAPMFVNVNPGARQWRPNLIGYDGLRVYGSPSYHAIKMFSTHLGDRDPQGDGRPTPTCSCRPRATAGRERSTSSS